MEVIKKMNFKLCLDYGCYPVWDVHKEGGIEPIATEELYFSDDLKKK